MTIAIIHQNSADTTQWNIFEEKWRAEHPSARDYAMVRSHRRPRRISLRSLLDVFAGGLAALTLMIYGVAVLWEYGVPAARLLPALAALVLAGIATALVTTTVVGRGDSARP